MKTTRQLKPPVVTITGTTGSGKTGLAYAIRHALESQGVHCVISGDEDDRVGAALRTWPAKFASLKGLTVSIVTKRVVFDPSVHLTPTTPTPPAEPAVFTAEKRRIKKKNRGDRTSVNVTVTLTPFGNFNARDSFARRSRMVHRPYIPISLADFTKLEEHPSEADIFAFLSGELVTYGDADGGRALMPVPSAYRDDLIPLP